MANHDSEKSAFLKPKISNDQHSFRTVLQFATKYDCFLFTCGIIATAIFSVSPIVNMVQNGKVFGDMEDNYYDLDEYYESERELAFINYALGIITLIIGMIAVVFFVKMRVRQGLFWKQAYFKTIANRPMKWFDKRNLADIGNTIDRECNTIEMGIGDKAMLIMSGIIFFGLSWVICFYLSIEMTLVLMLKFPLEFFSSYLVQTTSEKVLKEKQELYQTAGAIAEESLEGIKTVASCNAQHIIAKRYQAELEPLKNSGILLGIINGVAWGIFFFEFIFFTGLSYYFGAYLMDEGNESWTGTTYDTETVFLVSFTAGMSSFYLNTCLPCVEHIIASRVAATRVNSIIQKQKKHDGYIDPIDIRGEISFEKVYFNYSTKPEVNILRGVSFQVEAGESLAIVGETGSGKSTIIQLIEGFYYCSSGAVKIDGLDIKAYDLSALREFISLVSQEPILFNCTIEENIRIGKESASFEEIQSAAAEAEANSFIETLPDQYNTWVGVKGALISGGQKQRIALARALIKKPKILLLDEATSALDMNTEKSIQRTINRIMAGTTTVIVAQRLSTVKNAKQIIVVDQGKIVEGGTFEELVEKDGFFTRLLRVQKEGSHEDSSSIRGTEDNHMGQSKAQESVKKQKKDKDDGKVFARALKILFAYWPWLLLTSFAAVLAGSAIPIFAYFLADINNSLIDPTVEDKSEEVRPSFFCIIGASVMIFFGITIMCTILARISQLITYDLRYKSLYSLLFYDQKFYDKPTSAPSLLSSRLSNDCDKVSSLGGPILGLQLLVLTGMAAGIVVGLIHDVLLSLVVIAFLPLTIYSAIRGEYFAATGLANANLKKTSVIASDTFSNIKTVQAFNRQEYFFNQYIDSTRIENANAVKMSYPNGLAFGSRFFMMYSLWGTVAWYGAYRVSQGDLSMSYMLISFFCVMLSYIGFIMMGALMPDVEGGLKGGRNLFRIIDYTPAIDARSTKGYLEVIEGNIEFRKVNFQYKGRNQTVLDSVSFHVKAGTRLGVTGTTGSGKSTIAQLLLRFYDPTAGEIFLDSRPISSYNISHLRDSICWVGQEPVLFRGSILYNLQLAYPEVSVEEALEALDKAQAMDIVEKYGIDSDVGSRGNKLSGGQKQRIAIARALVRKPKVLVFDESTSALDPVTEASLMERVNSEKITIVSIAHRLQSIRDYEQIILIERGTVVECGNHNELMAKENGYYRELFNKSQ